MIEKSGDENLLKRKVDDGENVKEKKKKKKIAKSYLDDLWIMNIKTNKCHIFSNLKAFNKLFITSG